MAAENTSANGRFATFGKFHSLNDGDESSDPWNDSPLLSRDEPSHGHVCRPVIIGSDGSVTPVMVLDELPRHPTHHPARQHKEASPATKGGKAREFSGRVLRRQKEDFGSSLVDGDAYGESGPVFYQSSSSEEEPPAMVFRDGVWETAAEFLWGPERLPPRSLPLARTLQRRERSPAAAVIDSSEAVKKYGGKFVW
ncbi:hypothetical protein Cni_G12050 [Canna indica]|uniref:Uncharacterized protein n=1 Tax=Canna indica TaxID=4628 RepID=A0AAQ3QCB8_9LILI|nr:hypothetical protein Cni_G12050 [Canna indica]